jgi:hypothetical protein
VPVEDRFALVVARFADQPTEDAAESCGSKNARARAQPIEWDDLVLGDQAPVDFAQVGELGSPLDEREKPFDPWAVTANTVSVEIVLLD